MEGIFTLPYSEYEAINQLTHSFKKSDGFAFFIPLSRQQKGIDFLMLNQNSNKILKVQVKASRSYKHSKETKNFIYGLWFNNFIDNFNERNADLYILFGLYPYLSDGKNIKSKKRIWKSIILCFDSKEMYDLLLNVKTKKEQKKDRFFGFGFNETDEIFKERGFNKQEKISNHLLKNYYKKIEDMLK